MQLLRSERWLPYLLLLVCVSFTIIINTADNYEWVNEWMVQCTTDRQQLTTMSEWMNEWCSVQQTDSWQLWVNEWMNGAVYNRQTAADKRYQLTSIGRGFSMISWTDQVHTCSWLTITGLTLSQQIHNSQWTGLYCAVSNVRHQWLAGFTTHQLMLNHQLTK